MNLLNLLAIHGLGGGSYFFDGLAERLQPEYEVIAIDLPVSTPDFSMATWVDELGALVADRGAEPVVILGHSMGSMLALEAWKAWPERIRALIFVGGVPQVAPRIRERLNDRIKALEGARDLIGWGKKVAPGVFSPSTLRDRPDIVARFERDSIRKPSGLTSGPVRFCSVRTPRRSPAPCACRVSGSPANTISTRRLMQSRHSFAAFRASRRST